MITSRTSLFCPFWPTQAILTSVVIIFHATIACHRFETSLFKLKNRHTRMKIVIVHMDMCEGKYEFCCILLGSWDLRRSDSDYHDRLLFPLTKFVISDTFIFIHHLSLTQLGSSHPRHNITRTINFGKRTSVLLPVFSNTKFIFKII